MLLEIETKHADPDITIVSLTGRIVLGLESASVEKQMTDLLARNEKKVVLDIGDVSYIDSTGMGVITLCFTMMKKAGGGLRIARAKEQVWRQFKITKLDTVLMFSPSVEAACEGFAP